MILEPTTILTPRPWFIPEAQLKSFSRVPSSNLMVSSTFSCNFLKFSLNCYFILFYFIFLLTWMLLNQFIGVDGIWLKIIKETLKI
jgi:hypothetical protein